jgi:hypothetical protein
LKIKAGKQLQNEHGGCQEIEELSAFLSKRPQVLISASYLLLSAGSLTVLPEAGESSKGCQDLLASGFAICKPSNITLVIKKKFLIG